MLNFYFPFLIFHLYCMVMAVLFDNFVDLLCWFQVWNFCSVFVTLFGWLSRWKKWTCFLMSACHSMQYGFELFLLSESIHIGQWLNIFQVRKIWLSRGKWTKLTNVLKFNYLAHSGQNSKELETMVIPSL